MNLFWRFGSAGSRCSALPFFWNPDKPQSLALLSTRHRLLPNRREVRITDRVSFPITLVGRTARPSALAVFRAGQTGVCRSKLSGPAVRQTQLLHRLRPRSDEDLCLVNYRRRQAPQYPSPAKPARAGIREQPRPKADKDRSGFFAALIDQKTISPVANLCCNPL